MSAIGALTGPGPCSWRLMLTFPTLTDGSELSSCSSPQNRYEALFAEQVDARWLDLLTSDIEAQCHGDLLLDFGIRM